MKLYTMLGAGGSIGNAYEMLYQNEFDYIFDSSKFEQYFQFDPTSYSLGIAETISFLKSGT
jgi:hypothetical protein